jgi:hypothetical protein
VQSLTADRDLRVRKHGACGGQRISSEAMRSDTLRLNSAANCGE